MLNALAFIRSFRAGDTRVAAEHAWLSYIVSAEERIVNFERIHSIKELAQANPVLDYVERTLQVLDRLELSFWKKDVLEEVLIWSEVAKGGTSRERIQWQEAGIHLFVHNRGSAQLYESNVVNTSDKTAVIQTLIRTHGLIGQTIRGEVPLKEQEPLVALMKEGKLSAEELRSLLLPLNECIIAGVSETLWESVRYEVEAIIERIVTDSLETELSFPDRLARIRSHSIQKGENFEAEFAKLIDHVPMEALASLLERTTLWFVESALQEFSLEQLVKYSLLSSSTKRGMSIPLFSTSASST
ncbi:hypothetical protein [Paenibacillus sp. N3.4]|uniref:hypothetical protein n=1 Tax=Paenibacillus sp. N3.4 TaxID=2603222 RepID=UPI0011C86F92|nr:hypothetical protein FU659_21510 [Paenibacillus sp. N3.4]